MPIPPCYDACINNVVPLCTSVFATIGYPLPEWYEQLNLALSISVSEYFVTNNSPAQTTEFDFGGGTTIVANCTPFGGTAPPAEVQACPLIYAFFGHDRTSSCVAPASEYSPVTYPFRWAANRSVRARSLPHRSYFFWLYQLCGARFGVPADGTKSAHSEMARY